MSEEAPFERPHPAKAGMRTTLIGVGLNFLLALVKGAAGFLGNSYALVADAVESMSDVVSSLVVWAGLRISVRPPDEDHPYGHGKAEPMAAMVVSLALFGAAYAIARHSIHEIRTPHHAPAPFTLVVLLAVIATKELLFRYVIDVGHESGSTAVQTDAWHHRSDAITSAAAFVGITIALIGGPGWESADDWAALFASFIIVFNAWRLLRIAVAELTDASPDASVAEHVRQVAAGVSGVEDLHNCLVRKMGFDYFVDLDVIVDRDLPVHRAHDIAHDVQNAIRRSMPMVSKVLVHIEPTGKRREG